MVTFNVQQLDVDVVARLKRRAALNNRSLEGEARHILQRAVDDDTTAKRAAFPKTMERLRPLTDGRK